MKGAIAIGLVTLLAQAVPLEKCSRKVVVNGPKTAECPEGRYVVTYDETKNPPEASYACEKPVTPSPEPSPSVPPPSPSPEPSATPTPEPSPTPSVVPSATPPPTPTPPPSDEWVPGTIPPENVCPKNYPIEPDFVTLGESPQICRDGMGDNKLCTFNVVPRMKDPKYCAHRGGKSGCEQWPVCAAKYDPVFTEKEETRPAIRVWGPGGFNGDEVVRASRVPNKWEPPCPQDNPRCYSNLYQPRMTIGSNGSPPGRYEMCVAPTEKTLRTDRGACRFYDLKKQGQ